MIAVIDCGSEHTDYWAMRLNSVCFFFQSCELIIITSACYARKSKAREISILFEHAYRSCNM